MGLRERIAAFFVPPGSSIVPDEREPTPEQLSQQSIAWSGESGLGLGPVAGIKYNPDDLIGRKGFSIYKRMMFDEQCKAVMYFKRSAITGREWMFKLDGEKHGLSETEAARRVDMYNAMLASYSGSFSDGLNAIMKALWQGYSMTEQLFDTFEFDDRSYWGIRELKPKPFDTFYPNVDTMGQVNYWVQRGGWMANETRIDLAKFVYYRFNADFDEHYGGSDLRAAYRAFLSKDIAIRFFNIFMERLAAGFIVMKPGEGRTIRRDSQEWRDLTNILSNVSGKTSMLLPQGIDVEVITQTGGQVSIFKEAIDAHDHAIAKAALVPNLLGMGPPQKLGSYAQSDTQFDVFMIIADDESGRLAEALNEQVFAPLGQVNFADGIAPEFVFKPLDKRKTAGLLDMWTKILTAKGAQASESDEQHIREMLEFPDKTELLEPPVPVAAPAAPAAGTPQSSGQASVAGTDAPPNRGANSDATRDKPNRGRGNLSDQQRSLAFARAQARVAFAVIDRQSGAELERNRKFIEDALANCVADGVRGLTRQSLSEQNVGKFDLDGTRAMQLNTQIKRMLKAGYDIGADHARRELDRAKGVRFADRRIDMQRLGDMAAEWLKQKSFTITGDLRAGAVKEIKNVLVGALKNTWSDREIRERIYTALVNKGYLGSQSAADALTDGNMKELGEILGAETEVTPARLETVIRTNMFEAINEARLDMFTDPALTDFVTGMQYSAILDSRTTDICESLDGHAYTTDRWEDDLRPWVPPNHFNCRSLLVPVTRTDEQDFDQELPDIEPQEGFG